VDSFLDGVNEGLAIDHEKEHANGSGVPAIASLPCAVVIVDMIQQAIRLQNSVWYDYEPIRNVSSRQDPVDRKRKRMMGLLIRRSTRSRRRRCHCRGQTGPFGMVRKVDRLMQAHQRRKGEGSRWRHDEAAVLATLHQSRQLPADGSHHIIVRRKFVSATDDDSRIAIHYLRSEIIPKKENRNVSTAALLQPHPKQFQQRNPISSILDGHQLDSGEAIQELAAEIR